MASSPDNPISPTTSGPAHPPSSIQSPSNTITPTHFQHRTTNAAAVNTYIDTATPALNSTPIELDSTPVSPITRSAGSWKVEREQQLGGIGKTLAKSALGEKILATKVGEKLLGGKEGGLKVDDPAVMSGPPGTPGAEDFEVVEQREGSRITKEMD